MKNQLLLAGAMLTLAACASAGPNPKKKSPVPTDVHCAVMTSRSVNVKAATAAKMYTDYKGNRYFFCCGGCPASFKSDPAKYAKNDHIPTPSARPAKGKS